MNFERFKVKKVNDMKKMLWIPFSRFIRLRDTKGRSVKCISCDAVIHFGTINCQAGHFTSKSQCPRPGLIFFEPNVNAQCSRCNEHLGGNQLAYRKGMIEKYGEHILNAIEIKRSCVESSWQPFEYWTMWNHYKTEVKKLEEKYL